MGEDGDGASQPDCHGSELHGYDPRTDEYDPLRHLLKVKEVPASVQILLARDIPPGAVLSGGDHDIFCFQVFFSDANGVGGGNRAVTPDEVDTDRGEHLLQPEIQVIGFPLLAGHEPRPVDFGHLVHTYALVIFQTGEILILIPD